MMLRGMNGLTCLALTLLPFIVWGWWMWEKRFSRQLRQDQRRSLPRYTRVRDRRHGARGARGLR